MTSSNDVTARNGRAITLLFPTDAAEQQSEGALKQKDDMQGEAVSSNIHITRRFLTRQQVAALFQVHTRTIYRWESAGLIPEPKRIGDGTTRWDRADIETWIKAGCPACVEEK